MHPPLFVDGPVGQLEARIDVGDSSTVAVLCHPHPQYGGSMHDSVLATVASVMSEAGIGCVRFNFRGVGASEGSFDSGAGEVDDVIAVARFVRRELAPASLMLVGYSFGALMALAAVARPHADVGVSRLVLIAPPLGHVSELDVGDAPDITLIHGTGDAFVPAAAVEDFGARHPDAAIESIDGADHFFAGAHGQVADCVRVAISG